MPTSPQNNHNINRRNSNLYSLFIKIIRYVIIFLFIRHWIGRYRNNTKKENIIESKINIKNGWLFDTKFDLRVIITTQNIYNEDLNQEINKKIFETYRKNLIYNDLEFIHIKNTIIKNVNQILDFNKSIYAHIFFYKNGDKKDYLYHKINLIKYRIKTINQEKNLLFNHKNLNDKTKNSTQKSEKLSPFWNPNLNLRLIYDNNQYNINSMPPHLKDYININYERNEYEPIFYHDDFWVLDKHYIEITKDKNHYNLNISYQPISLLKWQFRVQMEKSFALQKEWMKSNENDLDDIKKIFLETNPYFLLLTTVISILHFIFEILAFKNDISFWKDKNDFHGLSVKTIFIDFICNIIIFLYLLENETSWMIIFGSFTSIGISFWKIKKISNIKYGLTGGGWKNKFPWISIEDKESYCNSSTSKYDIKAIKYLSYILLPLVCLYSIYSLIYEKHNGWYEWILSTLVGSVYTFGFITMCPQLYINYKLKSVAHLPWRMMTYKALNTVIDDLFAFIIKMPVLHRISCFRDDLVFIVFLYQRWKYRVDYGRVNEFGYRGKEENKKMKSNGDKIKNE